jgi:GNAT superfamily N-acetyltransferase
MIMLANDLQIIKGLDEKTLVQLETVEDIVYGTNIDPKFKGRRFWVELGADFENSLAVLDKDGYPIAGYIVGTRKLDAGHLNLYSADLKGLRGVEGVSFFIHPRWQSKGIGTALLGELMKEWAYRWGFHAYSLKNVKFWLRNAKIVFDSGRFYVSLRLNPSLERKVSLTESGLYYFTYKRPAFVKYLSDTDKEGIKKYL